LLQLHNDINGEEPLQAAIGKYGQAFQNTKPMIGRHKIIFTISLLVSGLTAAAQDITIYENDGKTPVAGAHIFCQNLQTKAGSNFLSNADGQVKLDGHARETLVIHIYALGFKRVTDTLNTLAGKQYILERDAASLNDLVITAQYAPNNPENAVHNVRIIDQKKITAMGAVNLRDLMRNELNIKVSEDNVLGSGLSMQGISGQNVKILIDGVPVIGRLNDNVDISQINLNNIERVEMIDGPLSVSYGTDALAGTINLITKKNTQQRKFTADAEGFYESIGQYNLNGTLGYALGNHSFRLNGGRNYFDGWKAGDKQFSYDFNPVADSSRFQTWKPKEQYFSTFNYGYRFKELQFNYNFDYFYEKIHDKGEPVTTNTIYAMDNYYRTWRVNNAVSVDGKLGGNFRLNGLVAYNYFKRIKNTYRKDLTNLDETLVPETPSDDNQDTSVFRTFMSRATVTNVKPDAFIQYEIGYNINYDYASGARILDTRQTMGDYALFGSAELKPWKNFVVRPGLRLAYNSAYDAPLIPSVNIRHMIPLGEANNSRITWRASYARGFRAPSLKELYFDFVDVNHDIHGNPDLKAEYSNNFTGSVNYSQTKGEWALKSEMQAYYNDIKDMIALVQTAPNTNHYAYFNIGKFKSFGVTAQQSVSYRHIKASMGGSYIARYNELSESTATPAFQYSPEVRANIYYEWHQQDITFGIFYKYNGVVPGYVLDTAGVPQKANVGAYSWADASVSKRCFDRMLDITIGAKNLFNVTNITGSNAGDVHGGGSSSLSVGMGRSYFIKVGVHINNH